MIEKRNRLARGRLRVRCDTCGTHYKTGNGYVKPPYSCRRPECAGTVRRETLAEQAQRLDAWAQFRADAQETFAAQRVGRDAKMPSTLTNRPWNKGGPIVRGIE